MRQEKTEQERHRLTMITVLLFLRGRNLEFSEWLCVGWTNVGCSLGLSALNGLSLSLSSPSSLPLPLCLSLFRPSTTHPPTCPSSLLPFSPFLPFSLPPLPQDSSQSYLGQFHPNDLHLKHNHVSTAQFKKRTTHMDIHRVLIPHLF